LHEAATPGPWHGDGTTVDGDALVYAEAGGWEIAVLPRWWEQGPSEDQVRANAALLAALRTALPALLDRIEAEEWRPIEEAPKDGMSILAIVAGTHPQTGEPFVPEVVEWDEGDSCWWNCMWGYDNAHSTYNPTHWRHLPAAPTTGGADA